MRLTTTAILACLLYCSPAFSIGIPLEQIEDRWVPVRADDVQLVALRMSVVPSMDDQTEQLVWLLDASFVVRNFGSEDITLHLGVPNAWSARDYSITASTEDFWGEAFVNGAQVVTEVVALAPSPAHSEINYRSARRFQVSLTAGLSAHVRVRYALPVDESDYGEQQLSIPFHLRSLWDGAIDYGVISVRWHDRMFSFRTNLPSYALYGDRAEWFVRGFEPDDDLIVRFLSRRTVFELVARGLGCPMPWEVMDRVTEGNSEPIEEMLSEYTTDVLEMCAALPLMLRGSQEAAGQMGLSGLTIERFAPNGSELTGPLFFLDPDFRPESVTDTEGIFIRFLRQELARREEH